jgi:protein SCO1/2
VTVVIQGARHWRNGAVAGLALAVVLSGACRDTAGPAQSAPGAASTAPEARPVELQTFEFGGDFVLTDDQGRPFDLASGRGRVHLLFFGFTMCPDVCPMTLSRIARAFNLLTPEERADVVTLFATVDVDRDTPAVLASHLKGFPVPVVGLTGTRAHVDGVVNQYKASYEITPSDSAGGPTVSHSTYLYLIDRDGRVRHLFRLADSPEQIAAGLRLALQAPRAR